LTNHLHDPTDKGTVWFDDSDAETKMLEFLEAVLSDPSSVLDPGLLEPASATDILPAGRQSSVLDLGTGNGSLLFELVDSGWEGPMLGVDYSERSVEFARRIARTRRRGEEQDGGDDKMKRKEEDEEENNNGNPRFLTHDILHSPASQLLSAATAPAAGWDVMLDKGTFDAVSLSAEPDASERYRDCVLPLLRPGGIFVITSCNWTEQELGRWFDHGLAEGGGGEGERRGGLVGEEEWVFRQVGKIQYPSFSFGGVKGQTISTLCFQKSKTSIAAAASASSATEES
jgi:EEF1A lysine methyltransferase 2